MTGKLLAYPWEGHRNEAFAEYALSSIATVVRVPRQADFGFDLLCTLTHYSDKALYAGKSFGVQIKPLSAKDVTYGALDKKNDSFKWKDYEINWLFSQEQPLFIGIVDLKNHTLNLYSTHRIWWIYNEIDKPGQIVLKPDVEPKGDIGLNWFKKKELPSLDGGKKVGDGYCYEVPLGKPIVSIDVKLLEQNELHSRNSIEDPIKDALDISYQNITNRNNKIPITIDQDVWTGGKYLITRQYHSLSDNQKKSLLESIAPMITSLLQNYNFETTEDLESLVYMAKLLQRRRCIEYYGILLLEEIESLTKQ